MSTLVSITSLQPSSGAPPSNKAINAVVTLCWPFSSSTRQCALLLAESDFRLRNARGQVRVRFTGRGAEAVARAHIGIGHEVRLDLRGAQWAGVSTDVRTPGKSVEAELVFGNELSMVVRRDGVDESVVVVPGDTPPQEEDEVLEDVRSGGVRAVDPMLQRLEDGLVGGVYASPAFVKRVRLSGQWMLDAAYDPFSDADAALPAKRARLSFGQVRNWRYTERTPSPDPSIPGTEDIENCTEEYESPTVMRRAPTMPPPALLQLGLPKQVLQSDDELHRPLKPTILPVSSSTLPLPSPFPAEQGPFDFGDLDHMHRLHTTPHAFADVPFADHGVAAQALVDQHDETSNVVKEDATEERAEQNVYQEREPESGNNTDEDNDETHDYDDEVHDLTDDSGSPAHPEYLSDTEEDEEMYSNHVTRGRPYRDVDLDDQRRRIDKAKAQEIDPEALAGTTNDDEPKSDIRDAFMQSKTETQPNAAVLQGSARVDKDPSSSKVVSSTVFDDAAETPTIVNVPKTADREHAMKQTYQSLFGFGSSQSPSEPTHILEVDATVTNLDDAANATYPAVADTDQTNQGPSVLSDHAVIDISDETGIGDVPHHVEVPSLTLQGDMQASTLPSAMPEFVDLMMEDGALPTANDTILHHESANVLHDHKTFVRHAAEPPIPQDLHIVHTELDLMQNVQHDRSFASLGEFGEHVVHDWISGALYADAPDVQDSFITTTSLATESMPPTEVPSFLRIEDETHDDMPNRGHVLNEQLNIAPAQLQSVEQLRPFSREPLLPITEVTSQVESHFHAVDPSNQEYSMAPLPAVKPGDGDTALSSRPESPVQHRTAIDNMLADNGASYPVTSSVLQTDLHEPPEIAPQADLTHMEGDKPSSQVADASRDMLREESAEEKDVSMPKAIESQTSTATLQHSTDDLPARSVPEPAIGQTTDHHDRPTELLSPAQTQTQPQLRNLRSRKVESRQRQNAPMTPQHTMSDIESITNNRTAEEEKDASINQPLTTAELGLAEEVSQQRDGVVKEQTHSSTALQLTHQTLEPITPQRRTQRRRSTRIETVPASRPPISTADSTMSVIDGESQTVRAVVVKDAASVQDDTPSPTPMETPSEKPTTRKSIVSRLSHVPDVIAPYFTPRRSTRLQIEAEKEEEEANGRAAEVQLHAELQQAGRTADQKQLQFGISTSSGYFAPLSTLSEKLNPSSQTYGNPGIDLLAVVTRAVLEEPARAKKGPRDYYTVFEIADPSLKQNVPTQVEAFRISRTTLPIVHRGDVVLLRAFAVKSRNHSPYLLSTDASAWCVWRHPAQKADTASKKGKPAWSIRKSAKTASQPASIVEEVKGPPVEYGSEERGWAAELRKWWTETGCNVFVEKEVLPAGEQSADSNAMPVAELNVSPARKTRRAKTVAR